MSVPDTFTGAPAQVADALVPVDQHLAHEARMGDRHVIAEAALGDHMLHRHPILERAAITHKQSTLDVENALAHADVKDTHGIYRDLIHQVHESEYGRLGYLTVPNPPRPGCPYGNCGTVLGPHDVCGMTFYIACNMMLAFTLFFFVQVSVVPQQWKTSVNIAGLVTGIAWYNYTYMKSQWIETQLSPTTYRYTDWLITVPLQIVEFYFILKACGPTNPALGVKLFLCSLIMVFGGWVAEIDVIPKVPGFCIGMAGWLYIVYEVSAGEAASIARGVTSEAARSAFTTLRLIVTFGWTIYPIGFAIAYLCYFDQPAGVLSNEATVALNVIYNLADLINKGAFGLCVWSAAVSDRSK